MKEIRWKKYYLVVPCTVKVFAGVRHAAGAAQALTERARSDVDEFEALKNESEQGREARKEGSLGWDGLRGCS